MKRLTTLVVVGLFAFSFAVSSTAQEEFPNPITDHHKVLKKDVGNWEGEMKTFATGPDSKPLVSKVSETNRMILNGLWCSTTFKTDIGGVQFEGRGQFGYDPEKKKYIGTWTDTMSARLNLMEGTYDKKTNSLTMIGKMPGPDGNLAEYKNVTTYKDRNNRTFTMYMKLSGTDDFVKWMEVQYKRAPKKNKNKK